MSDIIQRTTLALHGVAHGTVSLTKVSERNTDPPGYDATIAKDGPVRALIHEPKALDLMKLDMQSNPPAREFKKDMAILQRKQSALYDRATGPIKQIAMMCFMAYMSGNGIQIFSILMTANLLQAPITAILASGQVFPKEEDWPQLDVLTPRLLFCVIQLGQFLFGLWKLDGMGLLPAYASDWISSMKVPVVLEKSI
jgi:hypothetical protein